jgi:hypothetical protein
MVFSLFDERLYIILSSYSVKSRMFNVIAVSKLIQVDRQIDLVLIVFWRAFKITINHDLKIPLFDKRLIR